MSGGWFGQTRHVHHYLVTVGADRDSEGEFIFANEGPTIGFGGDEMVIPATTQYLIDGRKFNLAAGLNGTSYGLRGIKVF